MNKYPRWICEKCAIKAGGKRPTCASYHMNLCDVCCEWQPVTQPRDYGYPKVTCVENKPKIMSELQNVKSEFVREGNIFAAGEIDSLLAYYKM